jgi:hypothetical protein
MTVRSMGSARIGNRGPKPDPSPPDLPSRTSIAPIHHVHPLSVHLLSTHPMTAHPVSVPPVSLNLLTPVPSIS